MNAHKTVTKTDSDAAAPSGARAGADLPPRKPGKKSKLVKNNFMMPETEYAALAAMKEACQKAGVAAKKSELLRAGIAYLGAIEPAAVKQVLATLTPLPSGRPRKAG